MEAAAGRWPISNAGSAHFHPTYPKSQEPYLENYATHPGPRHSRAGPKSGTCLQLLALTHLSRGAGGVRVASATAAEVGPGSAEPGKHRGPVPGAPQSHALKPKTSEKRAYRRARLRAMQNGGTYYRGRWHTTADLRALEYTPTPKLPRSLRAQPRRRQARIPPVPCLSWNAGGLSSAVYQEFMAWLDGQSKYQLIMLQETHWPQSSDYTSGHWMCIHSASDPAEAHDSYAGVMIMLSKKHFRDPAVHEIHKGRVLHVRATHVATHTTVDILVVYQHVWRSHLTSQRNHELRGAIWQHLHTACAKMPARHFLLVGGDFNASVRPKRHEAGPASMPSKASPSDQQLNRLLTAHNLCALNTWGARPAYTHYSHIGKTQIDYVLTRCVTAGQTSKMARPLVDFPVAGWRQAGHLPIQATLSIVPVHWRADIKGAPPLQYDKSALQAALTSDTEQVQSLRRSVQAEVTQVPRGDLHQLHQSINQILCQAVRRAFPAKPAEDLRISAHAGYRASARHVWHLYAQMKRARVATVGRLIQQWRCAAAFEQASRALREQSKQLKRAAFQDKLSKAEAAAVIGDQCTLHGIVRSLTPAHRKLFSRLRDQDGKLLSKVEEAQALADQGRATYALFPDLPIAGPLTQALTVTDEEVVQQFRTIQAGKAVPNHIAPAGMWKLCSDCLGPVFGAAFREHFQQGSPGLLSGDLTDATMAMLPKPNKPAHVLANLRPIGLMAPTSKALAGILKHRMMEWQLPLLRHRPQYAYLPNRGTLDALFRVHKHVAEALALFRASRITRFGAYRGCKPRPFTGALSLSLDLSRAFDLTNRPKLFQALQDYKVPPEVIEVAHRLHFGSRFLYKAGNCRSSFVPSNGLKQGCKVAPCLWVWYTLALMDALEKQLPEGWIQNILTLFADDCWASWLLYSIDDLRRALRELSVLLGTLEDFQTQINYGKTAVLLKFVGKQAKQALYDVTRFKNGVAHLCVVVKGVERLIPLKAEHDYLGSKVSYHNHREANLEHRVHSGQQRYHAVQRALTGRHVVSSAHRVRLWDACVSTSLLYSLPAVGLTEPSLRRLETRMLKHLRAILRLPAHLTRARNEDVWQQAQVDPPGPRVLQALASFRAKLEDRARQAPDITTDPALLEHVRSEEQRLRHLLQARAPLEAPCRPPDAGGWQCPHCAHIAPTSHALRIHCGLYHPEGPKTTVGQATAFDPTQHAVGGLPHCRLCGRQFKKWQNLRRHIEEGTCAALGGSSFVQQPRAEVEQRPAPPEQETPPDAPAAEPQNTPLVLRPFFLKTWSRWDTLLAHPALRHELTRHCVICQMFIMDTKHIKQHIRRMHPDIFSTHKDTVLQRCKPFKTQLVTNSNCPWCSYKVWSPGRHVDQCPVLFQLCLAAVHCEQQASPANPVSPVASAASTEVKPLPKDDGLGLEPRGGYFPALHVASGAAERPSAQDGHHPQQAASTGSAGPQRAKATICSFFPVRAGALRRPGPGHGQDDHETGGDHLRASRRQEPAPVLSGGRLQHPSGALPRGPRMESTAGGGNECDHLSHPHSAVGLSRSAAPGPYQSHDGGRRGGRKVASGGLAQRGQTLDTYALVPPGQETGAASRSRGDATSGPPGQARVPVGEPQRRGDPEVPLDQAPGCSRGRTGNGGGLLPLRKPTGGPCRTSARDLRAADRDLGFAASGAVSEAGHAQAPATGTADSPHRLRALIPTDTAGSVPSPLASLVPPFTLANDGNACYINSLLYAVWLVMVRTSSPLPRAIQSLQGDGVSARRALGYYMLGWPQAWLQHDVAEFYDFVVPRLARATGDLWQGRAVTEDVLRINNAGPLCKCIPLPLPPAPKTDVQELVDAWHQQEDLCALTAAHLWFSLQLPRFNAATGDKTHQPYAVPGTLSLPTFVDATSQAIERHEYFVHSIIRHHGATFRAGHYTVLVRGSEDFLLDDDHPPRKALPRDLDDTSQSMYVLIMCHSSVSLSLSQALSSSIASSVQYGQHGLDGPDSVHGAGARTISPALPSRNLDKAAGEGQ